MPVSSFVDSPNRLVITLCAGEITFPEISAMFDELRNHPGFRPEFRQLCDLSMATSIPLHFPDLYHLRQVCDPFSNEARRVFVAPDAVPFGLSRMYQLIINSPNFEVFRSLPEALHWLEWNGAQLEEIIRELLAKRTPPDLPQKVPAPGKELVVEQPSSNLADFLKRVHKAGS